MFNKQKDMLVVLRNSVQLELNPETARSPTTPEDAAYMLGILDGFELCLDSLMPENWKEKLMQDVEAYIKERN